MAVGAAPDPEQLNDLQLYRVKDGDAALEHEPHRHL